MDSKITPMTFQADPNLVRYDRWFSRPEEVAPFLEELVHQHPDVPPRLVSAALLQARRNLVAGTPRPENLQSEVSRLLDLPDRWQRPCEAAAGG
jgi:hypothetical protein